MTKPFSMAACEVLAEAMRRDCDPIQFAAGHDAVSALELGDAAVTFAVGALKYAIPLLHKAKQSSLEIDEDVLRALKAQRELENIQR